MANKKLLIIIGGSFVALLISILLLVMILVKTGDSDENQNLMPTSTVTPTAEPTHTTVASPTPEIYSDQIISFEIPEGWELVDSIPERFVGNFFGYQCTGVTLVRKDDEDTVIVVDPTGEMEESICSSSGYGEIQDEKVLDDVDFPYPVLRYKIALRERLENGLFSESHWEGDYMIFSWYNTTAHENIKLYPDKPSVPTYYIYNGENEYQQDYLKVLESLTLY